jgi:hypothetical protein
VRLTGVILFCFLCLSGGFTKADFNSLRKKAEKGDADAQYQLAEMYAEAQGVDQDYAKASQWARKAADQGNAKAQYRLASIMYMGLNGERLQPQGLQLFQKARAGLELLANNNDPDAKGKLGILFARGIGVQKDLEQASKLFEEAAKAGSVKAQSDLAAAYLMGRGVERNPTTAGFWFEKAAKAGYAEAQIQYGLMKIQGTGCRQDIKIGLAWLKKASQQRHPEGAKQAKVLLERLRGNPPKIGTNIDALINRAKKNELEAQWELAQRYEFGKGVKVDFSEAIKWLDAASRQGFEAAAHRLGGMFMMGYGTEKNVQRGAAYWKLAAELGHSGAQVDFAVASRQGDGVAKNLQEAYYWMLIARRGVTSEEQQEKLLVLQKIIASGLKSDEILQGLKRSREWRRPEKKKVRIHLVGAEYGDPESQFAYGQFIVNTHPVEALKWFRLAQEGKVKGAAKSADEQASKLSKAQIELVEKRVKEFKPLAP